MLLRTPRLLLREFTSTDASDILAYQRDPRYLRFYSAEERTEADVHALVQRFIAWQREEPRYRYQLAITLASSGELIGNVGLRRPSADAPLAEAGFELSPTQWGQGYATEAARALLEYGFGSLGLHRVHAHCIADNVGSARVLERLGMRCEGRLRQHEFFKSRRWDVLLYGMLASEWQASARLAPNEAW